ncbi:type IV pilus modification protein PilV [Agaribacterium haliotis]|uniref:type IV pilus modification protein PilV n=1 Tax=Agaribacterium haliotis TaxID=2013869 RepID=UPI000BB59B8A|nr:type IV pilus modification protein PilV [Agaribacterium haliotis]
MSIVRSRGSSLIEALVALFVLAVGLLGILAMQITSVKTSRHAASYSKAEALLVDMYESMQMSPVDNLNSFLITYAANTPALPDCNGKNKNCSEVQMATWSVSSWRSAVAASLPGGEGQIQAGASAGEYDISVRFNLGFEPDAAGAAGAVKQITEEVKLVVSFQ